MYVTVKSYFICINKTSNNINALNNYLASNCLYCTYYLRIFEIILYRILKTFLFLTFRAQTTPCTILEHHISPKIKKIAFLGCTKMPEGDELIWEITGTYCSSVNIMPIWSLVKKCMKQKLRWNFFVPYHQYHL